MDEQSLAGLGALGINLLVLLAVWLLAITIKVVWYLQTPAAYKPQADTHVLQAKPFVRDKGQFVCISALVISALLAWFLSRSQLPYAWVLSAFIGLVSGVISVAGAMIWTKQSLVNKKGLWGESFWGKPRYAAWRDIAYVEHDETLIKLYLKNDGIVYVLGSVEDRERLLETFKQLLPASHIQSRAHVDAILDRHSQTE